MARRKDHSREELHTLITDSAWQIVGADGAAGLTARRIAQEIGYTPGTIYNLFASMDTVALAVNARTLTLLHDALAAPLPDNNNVLAQLHILAQRYLQFARDYRPYWLMLFTADLTQTDNLPDWYQSQIDTLFAPLENVLRRHYPHQSTPVDARILWSAAHGIAMLLETGKLGHVAGAEDAAADAMISQLITRYTAGLEASPAFAPAAH